MRKLLLTASVLMMMAVSINAQCKYASSYSDLVKDNWVDVNSVSIEKRSATDKMWTGGADLKINVSDEALGKQIKQNARFILCDDSLFVNCRSLKYQNNALGNGFAKAYRLNNGDVFFVANKVQQSTPKRTTGSGFTFRVDDGKVTATDNNEKQSCYIISSDETKVVRVNRKYMKGLLQSNAVLSDSYNALSKKEQESIAVIVDYITQLQ